MNEWQPIKTAPKDGSEVMLYGTEGMTVGFYDTKAWCENVAWQSRQWFGDHGYAVSLDAQPTHWMPLPRVPEVPA